MKIDFIGPTNPHKTRKFDPQRTVNLFVCEVEAGKNKHFLQSIPGLSQFSPPPPVSKFTLVKSQDVDTATVGDAQVYTIVLTNLGPQAADGAVLTDDLPAKFTFTSCTIAYVGATGPSSATEADLLAGVAVTTWPVSGTVTLTITGTFNASGSVANTATVTKGDDTATDTVTAEVAALPVVTGFDPARLRHGPVIGETFWVLTDSNNTVTFTDPSGSPGSHGTDNVRSINGRPDKRYFEFVWSAMGGSGGGGGQIIVGVGPDDFSITQKVGYNTPTITIWSVGYDNLGEILEAGGVPHTVATYTLGDVVMIAVDPSNGHFWAGKNGTWNGNPAAGTGYVATAPVGNPLFVMVGGDNVNVGATPLVLYAGTGRFLSVDQTYAAPSGFTAWDD